MAKITSDGIIVGIYGIQGVGKSYILKQIAAERIEWRVVDGSRLIREVMDGMNQTMEHFEKHMTPTDKAAVRKAAIENAKKKPGITLIAGHCSFPAGVGSDGSTKFNDVFTPADGAAYDVIFYLERPVDKVFDQVQKDKERTRPQFSVDVLKMWVEHEKAALEAKCSEHNIAFRVFRLGEPNDYLDLTSIIVEKAVVPASHKARVKSERALVSSVEEDIPAADVYLLIDGDHTLCPQDTGTLFFDEVATLEAPQPLKNIFKRYDHYTFQAFWEVAMLYSNVLTPGQYNSLCTKIGREKVRAYKAWITFLDEIPSYVHPIIVSSSIREVWLAMQAYHVECNGQSSGVGRMSVIAGNNLLMHTYVIDDISKAQVVKTLRKLHGGCRIIGFGDSALDVPMLCECDYAYVVVDDKINRSMKDFIAKSVANNCRLNQLIDLDLEAVATKWHHGLPVQSLESLLEDLNTSAINAIVDCSSVSITAQILATKMRDANLRGPGLQKAHEEMGALLADKLIDEFGQTMGLVETVEFSHVQGGTFTGLGRPTCNVVILPLMRGGEPMARGVHSRFPSSLFIHLYEGEDDFDQKNNLLAKAFEHFSPKTPVNIVITDSVINTGSSIERAITNIRRMAREVNSELQLVLYVLSGVMQQEAAVQLPCQFIRVRFVTLRVSKNKYTGKGGSDTGNRLFGTTLID
mmetsp:Transcript_20635/g.44819  ORF Transcript_20635/g.44819 Transcript_20635/m.44819 type:complete len:690 (-) Transcript_20635:179-2248(-)|eukprot:CAMPEP_0172308904 /NCGR_PEP_ID=MMETSP1058-20130122/9363_1 /TAXON_ID=83371 /ORGANISM="Detonula confervacea, Strain CCMP 353" /LENGTH=689 /DNA_ID=CAMNT_0013021431 /DNA_START=1476 /DNA_END=3545 /DNA_ORIENTATION=-